MDDFSEHRLYERYDTALQEATGDQQFMTPTEAADRNNTLRSQDSPERWIPKPEEE